MNHAVPTFAILLLMAVPCAVLALAEERFGNAPAGKQPEWAVGVVDVVNLKTRVYSYWVNGNENFFYRGEVKAMNEALRAFAAVKADVRQVILLPGAGKQQSFEQKNIDFDWQLHVPSGIFKAVSKRHHAVMTVHVNAIKPRAVKDRKPIDQWLRDLEAEAFPTRDKARDELQKLGHDAKPFLREALKGKQSIEARRRILDLLDRLRDFDLSDLEIPKGLTVVRVDDLVAMHLKGLKDADTTVSSMAIQDLIILAPFSDKVVPALIPMLDPEMNRHVRHVAAACLGSAGPAAKAAVPMLNQHLKDKDRDLRAVFQSAIAEIEKAKMTPEQDAEITRRRAIVQEINAFQNAGAHK